ncbi:hypothetical protein [Pedobacter caeni]|uniref:Membrane domain of glycerophosphoryl diester phosphodiesterase n=1 Tax=Pedobacter caeni TaxID=288992 RepID=A0A1M5DA56_9SPHI|nr:hypothetical protein [Pedobacter caeni]SHF63821.1 hypothetical protein SAMN04488522_103138 [Pedobacter caeni]
MSEKLEFKKVREFGEIINDLFLFIKQNFKALLKVFVYFCGIFILGSMISGIYQQIEMQKSLKTADDFASMMGKIFNLNYLLVLIFNMVSYTAMNVSILSFIAVYVKKGNETPELEEVWAYFKFYFFRVLGSGILISIFVGLCFVCLLIPGIYVMPAMMLFLPVMIYENAGFSYSFDRAFKLLKGQWWVTFGTILLIYFIATACQSLASLPALILTFFSAFTEGAKGLSNTVIIISTTVQYLCQVFIIIPLVGISFCYFNLAERLDSTGLMDRIEQMGSSKDAFNTPEEY